MIDYHLHGNFCGHGRGELEEYVLKALEAGMIEIGFSAHLPKVKDPDPYHAMLEERLPEYIDLVSSLQERYAGRIKIRLGIEADYFEGYESRTREFLEGRPFDYVFGALHFLGDWHFSSKEGLGRYEVEDPARIYPLYFEQLGKMIETGLFDIVAHPDAIRKTDFRPEGPVTGWYRKTAILMKENGMAVEVNTGGLRRNAGSVYPEKEFLEICAAEGVPVTLGSDAHSPEDVGRDFDTAYRILAEAGISELALWEKRKMKMIAVPGVR